MTTDTMLDEAQSGALRQRLVEVMERFLSYDGNAERIGRLPPDAKDLAFAALLHGYFAGQNDAVVLD